MRGLRQLVCWPYGSQASAGSEIAAAIDYLEALVHWHVSLQPEDADR